MKKVLFLAVLIFAFLLCSKAQIYFSEEFSNNALPTGWTNLDQDGDGKKWQFSNGTAISYSYYNNTGLRPDNWLISKAINLTGITGNISLSYAIAAYHANYPAEHYQVRISTTTNSVTSFSTILRDETLSQGGTWLSCSIDLSSYQGETIYLAFVHNDTYNEYALLLDDIMIIGENEIALESITTPTTILVDGTAMVTGKIRNLSATPLTSYSISYNIDGGEESSVYTVSGLNIAGGAVHNFTHDVPLPTNTLGYYTLNVTVSQPNGEADNTSNNTESMDFTVYRYAVEHRVLLENFATANCGNCPSATNQIKNWLASRPKIIWLVHHAGYYTDGLTIPASTSLTAFFNDGGSTYTPAIMLDRKHIAPDGDPGPAFSAFSGSSQLLDQIAAIPAFVTVNFTNASYNSSTRQLTITVEGEIVNILNGSNLRLSLYAKEDNLKTTPGQAGSSLGVNYIHNNTMRAAISNVWGESNVITSPNEGTTYSKTFTYTIPSNFDLEQLSFVAFVSQYNSNVNKRNIYNSKAVKMSDIISGAYVNDHTYHPTDPASIPTDNYTTPELLIYPNPADNFLFVETILNIESIKIFNVQGQYIDSKPIANTMIPISHLANGIYILQITTQEGNILTQRFVKQ